MKILVVDDDPQILDAVTVGIQLQWQDSTVLAARNGEEGLQAFEEHDPDVVVLDVAMPGMSGFEALRRIRQVSDVPVLMLTARGEEADQVRGLELGADDYLVKPFSHLVLLARIKAVLRRAELPPRPPRQEIVVDDRLRIDFDRREVIVDGQQVQLRPTEFRLLYHLASNPGLVQTHEQLLSKVWGPEYRDASHYLRLYINYLRQKIEPDPANPIYILTERGVGYRFVDYTRRQAPRPA